MGTNSLMPNLIISLHQRGFEDDIELVGHEFLCVQQKTFVRIGDLSILEWHRLYKEGRKKENVLVLGLSAESQGVNGILIVDFRNARSKLIHMLVNRFNQFSIESLSSFEFATN
jgi:hypothetical protein